VGERFVGSLPDAVSANAEARGNKGRPSIADFTCCLLRCVWLEDAMAQSPHQLS